MIEKNDFIEFLLSCDVLRFGDFTTKSGRKTPYFINTGLFRYGSHIGQLCQHYAEALNEFWDNDYTNIYGPAYKGIPLVVGTSMVLNQEFNHNVSYTFNRKEVKDHGEGGLFVGYQYEEPCEVIILEDVITAGTSLKETMNFLEKIDNIKVKGLLVSVDRAEKVNEEFSALQQAQKEYGIDVRSIIHINDIIAFLENDENRKKYNLPEDCLERMMAYRKQYGA
jgi:orotate phosphoribosyltransferase